MKHWSEHLICTSHGDDAEISNPIFDAENDGAMCATFCSQSRRPDGTVKRKPAPVIEMAPRREPPKAKPVAAPHMAPSFMMAPKPPSFATGS